MSDAMFEFEVTPDGGGESYKVSAGSRDILVLERSSKVTLGKLLSERRMGDLYWLAWLVAKREGHFDGSRREFEESCELSFVVDDEDEPDPTQPAP